jgi:hypothetical protein
MQTKVSLVPIDRDGTPCDYAGSTPNVVREVLSATAELYAKVGFDEPWIGYLALAGEKPVGTCGFKTPLCNGRVEIAYFTFADTFGVFEDPNAVTIEDFH